MPFVKTYDYGLGHFYKNFTKIAFLPDLRHIKLKYILLTFSILSVFGGYSGGVSLYGSVSSFSFARDTVLGETVDLDAVTVPDNLADSLRFPVYYSGIDTDSVSSIFDIPTAFDTLPYDSLLRYAASYPEGYVADTVRRKGAFDEPIFGKNKDSLIYDVKTKNVYIFKDGQIEYQEMELKADYIRLNMETKLVYANGIMDTVLRDGDSIAEYTRPEFVEGGKTYTMDTIVYNINSKKAKIRGVITQEGEGILHGSRIKKMEDNTVHVLNGKYTTCDCERPHFYMAMTKATMIPNKKVVVGPSYLVVEDVPIYFLGLPFGFFPINRDRNSGFIMPEFGEETVKGFFLRNGGYYHVFNDYVDARITGGIYTLGSWQLAGNTTYRKRYKFNGSFSLNYAKDRFGEKDDPEYVSQNNFNLQWTHTQDGKFRPNSTFSASVNFSSQNYNKYNANNLNDYLNTQTNSSIAYSKSWTGTPFSMSMNASHSQNVHDTTLALNLPNILFNMTRINPFKRKEAMGPQRWYEKISLQYTMNFSNNINIKEYEFMKPEMFDKMKFGAKHTIPIQASFNLFKYLNINPTANYNERWYFRKIEKDWDDDAKAVMSDTSRGFYRVYDYNFSVPLTTKFYGMYEFKGKNPMVKAIRHVMTPSFGFSFSPNFGESKYGFYKSYQADSTGRIDTYSPFANEMYGVPGNSANAALTFSLSNTVEMKVRSKTDTTGFKKVRILESFNISSSYDFLADSMQLRPFSVSLRSTLFKGFGINANMSFDPYQVDKNGRRINKFMVAKGSLARLTNFSTSFGYNFSSGNQRNNDSRNGGTPPAMGIRDDPSTPDDFFGNGYMSPELQRQQMRALYYDFEIPWNFGFSYQFNYTNSGIRSNIMQTVNFNADMNLTKKWAVSFDGGYDIKAGELSPGAFTLTRDLHCWQMDFSWIPVGFRSQWSFTIRAKSGLLQDLKYDKRNSYLDNLYGE